MDRETAASAEIVLEAPPARPPARSRAVKLAFLAFGLGVAFFLGHQAPREQHVRFVLGDAARDVTAVDIQYLGEDGDVARETRRTYAAGAAPRVVVHDSKLPDGPYRVRIDVDTREGRRSTERQVTLGGGSTQVELSSFLLRETHPEASP